MSGECFNCHSRSVVANLTTVQGTLSPLLVCEHHAGLAVAAGIPIVLIEDGKIIGNLAALNPGEDTP